jgi:hypothetical protein
MLLKKRIESQINKNPSIQETDKKKPTEYIFRLEFD